MKILVTGGAGFVGSHLCPALRDIGHKVRVIDINNKASKALDRDYRAADILDIEAIREAMKGTELVVHLAAKHRYFGVSENEFFTVNEHGTRNVLKAMDQEDVKKIIFFSTVAVYGEPNGHSDETLIPQPTTPYGVSKLRAEHLIKKWVSEKRDGVAIIIRPTVIFGPYNKGNIYRLIRQIYYRAYLPIGEGSNIKSIAYIDNVVKATLYLISLDLKEGVHIFNYADPPHLSYKEIVEIIYSGLGRRVPRYSLPLTPMIKISKRIDKIMDGIGIKFSLTTTIKKMNKETYHKADKIMTMGFYPECSSIEGLKRMVNWYLQYKNQA